MGMVVRSNIMAINANRQLGMNNNQVGKSLEKLASGYRINRAGDDASGLAISEKMKAQIRGLETASSNSQDGISLVQTAEGALTEVHDMLNRMVELAGKSANGTMDTNVDRASLQKEMNALKDEINRIAKGTNFNGTMLLDGSLNAGAKTANMILGGTELTFSAGTGLNAAAVVKFDGSGASGTGIVVSAGLTSELTITMEAGKTFSASEINEAVRSFVSDELAGGATDTNEIAGYKDFNIKIPGGSLTNPTGGFGTATSSIFAVPAGTTAGTGLTLQVGDTAADYNKLTVSIGDMSTKGLGIDAISVADQDSASAALDLLKNNTGANDYGAINIVSATRADLGALQNRLEHTINNLDVAAENMSAANSRIRDTDMAKEMMEYTKMNVLTQAAQAMLAQANSQPQSILQLLQ